MSRPLSRAGSSEERRGGTAVAGPCRLARWRTWKTTQSREPINGRPGEGHGGIRASTDSVRAERKRLWVAHRQPSRRAQCSVLESRVMRSLQPKISQRQNVQCWTSNPFRGWSERQTSLCVGGRFHSRATPCLNRSGQTPSAMSCCAGTRIGFKSPDDNSCGLLGKSVVALALSGWENRLPRYCQALDSFENRQPYLDLSTSLVQVLVPLREAAGGSAPTSDVIMAEPRIEAALLRWRCRMV